MSNLTLIATIFLPLSLGSSLLSMQTRFADLGLLLYDFVGVGVLLASVMVLVLFFVRRERNLSRRRPFNILGFSERSLQELVLDGVIGLREARKLRIKRAVDKWYPPMKTAWQLAFACYVLVSFLVGMFQSSDTGLKLLWIGMLGFLSVPFIFLVLTVDIHLAHFLYRRLKGGNVNAP